MNATETQTQTVEIETTATETPARRLARTKNDLLRTAARFDPELDVELGADDRLETHGFVDAEGELTETGEAVGALVYVLKKRGMFEATLDVTGVAELVDIATYSGDPFGDIAMLHGAQARAETIVGRVRPAGLYEGKLDSYNPVDSIHVRDGLVEVSVNDEATADLLRRDFEARGFETEGRSDSRYKNGVNPLRFSAHRA